MVYKWADDVNDDGNNTFSKIKTQKRHSNHKNLIICYSFIIHNDDSDNDGAGDDDDDDGIYIKFPGSMIKTPTKMIGANQRAICL